MVVTLVVASIPAQSGGASSGSAGDDDFEVVGNLPAAVVSLVGGGSLPDYMGAAPAPMAVDARHSLGIAAGALPATPNDGADYLALYDLTTMRLIERVPALKFSNPADPDRPSAVNAQQYPKPSRWLVDEANQRIFVPETLNPTQLFCTPLDDTDSAAPVKFAGSRLRVVEYSADAEPHFRQQSLVLPCSGAARTEKFSPLAASFDQGSGRFYFAGTYARNGPRLLAPGSAGAQQNEGDSLLVRQMSFVAGQDGQRDRLELDWEVDLQTSGCGRREFQFVRRIGKDVLAYCSDLKAGRNDLIVGRQGYVVRVGLEDEHPVTEGGALKDPVSGVILNARVRRTPALPGLVTPVTDPVAGNLVLATSDAVNGNAAWVFDPRDERFVGVATGGFVDQPAGNIAVGFDDVRGRLYLLTKGGIVAVPVRRQPLGSVLHRVVSNDAGNAREGVVEFVYRGEDAVAQMAVAPAVGRLFIPVTRPGSPCSGPDDEDGTADNACARYVVVEDRTAEAGERPPSDPDRLTTQVGETEGRTAVDAGGIGTASGARVIVTGGLTRAASQASPTCHNPYESTEAAALKDLVVEPRIYDGECLAEQVISSGDRNVVFAASAVEASTSGVITADSSGFTPADQATDGDVLRAGECHESSAAKLGRVTDGDPEDAREELQNSPFGPLFATLLDELDELDEESVFDQLPGGSFDPDFSGFCEPLQNGLTGVTGDDLRRGTAGGTDEEPGSGFPVPAAHCDGFETGEAGDEQPGASDPRRAVTSASVACDGDEARAVATSRTAGIAVPSLADPVITVGELSSTLTSLDTGEGRVTIARAAARDVRIGPLRIAEVRSEAVTRAKGVAGSTRTEFTRWWCGIEVDGHAEAAEGGCIQPDRDEGAQRLVDQLNQVMGRVRLSLPAAQQQATPGGYQSVVIKDPEVQAADRAVNNDDSVTVPALQAVFYNDGAEGRSRVVVQLAGVHAESRYGITSLPRFSLPTVGAGPTGMLEGSLASAEPTEVRGARTATASATGEPGFVEEFLPGTPAVSARSADDGPLAQLFRAPLNTFRRALEWLVNNPREFALLLLLLSILAIPVYLMQRWRTFERTMAT